MIEGIEKIAIASLIGAPILILVVYALYRYAEIIAGIFKKTKK